MAVKVAVVVVVAVVCGVCISSDLCCSGSVSAADCVTGLLLLDYGDSVSRLDVVFDTVKQLSPLADAVVKAAVAVENTVSTEGTVSVAAVAEALRLSGRRLVVTSDLQQTALELVTQCSATGTLSREQFRSCEPLSKWLV